MDGRNRRAMLDDEQDDKLMQIGDLAKIAGVTVRTVRYYEELELLEPVDRSEGGFRLYDMTALRRLLLIQSLRTLDFSLKEIQEFMRIRERSETGATAAIELLRVLNLQLERINKRIAQYTAIRDDIRNAIQLAQECCGCSLELATNPCQTCDYAAEIVGQHGDVGKPEEAASPLLPISFEAMLS